VGRKTEDSPALPGGKGEILYLDGGGGSSSEEKGRDSVPLGVKERKKSSLKASVEM